MRGDLHDLIQIRRNFLMRLPCGRSLSGNLQTCATGQFLDRLDETHSGVLHHKPDRRTMRPAAETMIELLGLTDGKRGRFFAVEWTTSDKIRSCFFERHIALDHVHDIETIEQVLYETFWNHPGRSCVSRILRDTGECRGTARAALNCEGAVRRTPTTNAL